MPNNYGTGPVPQNWSGQDRKFADSLKENVDVICGHRGDPLDRAVTARDLLDSGLATLPAGANFYSGFSNGLWVGICHSTWGMLSTRSGEIHLTASPAQPF